MNRRGQDRTGPLGGAGMVGLWGASSLIASVQTGTLSNAGGTTNTATIASVIPANCIVLTSWLTQANYASDQRNAYARIDLTNATTLTITINFNAGYYTTCRYTVVEFMPGVIRSNQSGTISVASGATSNTATITSVNTAKSFVLPLGTTEDSNAVPPSSDPNAQWFTLTLTNATTVTALRNTAAAVNNVVGYQVVEFF